VPLTTLERASANDITADFVADAEAGLDPAGCALAAAGGDGDGIVVVGVRVCSVDANK
jgi:hypothetical protein